MKTEGKAVDSVIQYQLHKQNNGEGGDSFKCNYVGYKLLQQENTTLSQEEIQELESDIIYGIALDGLNPGYSFIRGVIKTQLNASIEDLMSNYNNCFMESSSSEIIKPTISLYNNSDYKTAEIADNEWYAYTINEKLYYYTIDAYYPEN